MSPSWRISFLHFVSLMLVNQRRMLNHSHSSYWLGITIIQLSKYQTWEGILSDASIWSCELLPQGEMVSAGDSRGRNFFLFLKKKLKIQHQHKKPLLHANCVLAQMQKCNLWNVSWYSGRIHMMWKTDDKATSRRFQNFILKSRITGVGNSGEGRQTPAQRNICGQHDPTLLFIVRRDWVRHSSDFKGNTRVVKSVQTVLRTALVRLCASSCCCLPAPLRSCSHCEAVPQVMSQQQPLIWALHSLPGKWAGMVLGFASFSLTACMVLWLSWSCTAHRCFLWFLTFPAPAVSLDVVPRWSLTQ